jgi:hypothetical protein
LRPATLAGGGSLIPELGGVLVQDEQKRTIGAVRVTGDTSDNDEATAFADQARRILSNAIDGTGPLTTACLFPERGVITASPREDHA